MSNSASAQILKHINTLPPLPAAIGRLLRLLDKPDVEFKEIARTISLDQTLTAQLLRVANSAFYGFSHEIRTVQQASVLLGRYTVRNMAMSLATVTMRNQMKKNSPLRPEVFWQHNMAVACGARLLAKYVRSVDPAEAFVAALLHDIGKIVLVEYDISAYERLLVVVKQGLSPLHVLERETFGIDHAEIGEALCQHWNIPELLGEAVAAHHGTIQEKQLPPAVRKLVEIVRAANTLAKHVRLGDSGNPLISVTWLEDIPTFGRQIEYLDRTMAALPQEVAANEQIFFNKISEELKQRLQTKESASRKVLISISSPEQRALGIFVLRSVRVEPVTKASPAELTGVLADNQFSQAKREACRQRNIPVLDFAHWQRTHAPTGWINVGELQSWITESLSAPSNHHEYSESLVG